MNHYTRQRGYTLIELTVSIGIFSIIMLLATGAYLSLISYTREARATSTIMTSLSYSIDQMAREVRTGTDYACGTGDCTAGTTLSLTNDQGDDVTYTLINGAIGRCVNQSTCNASTAEQLTDPSVTVSHLLFYVKGTSSSDAIQPSAVMVVQGQAAVPGSTPVSFSIETSATERIPDIADSSGSGGSGGGGDGGGGSGGTVVATGGTVTQADGYTYHTFAANGTFAVSTAGTVDVLIVGGGGGGGGGNGTQCVMGGGGGAGGLVSQAGMAVTAKSYPIGIGIGGRGGTTLTRGNAGGASSFNSVTASGGGGGGFGNCSGTGLSGDPGASGGGGGWGNNGTGAQAGGTGIAGQGNKGAASQAGGASGGGGGAGAAATSGLGGAGVTLQGVTFATGGQGNTTGLTAGVTSPAATANTGNGGAGGWSAAGGTGGSGVVIIRYLTP